MSSELGRHPRVWRTLGLSVAWLLVVSAAGLALLYAVPEVQLVHWLATLAAVFIPFAALFWGVGTVMTFNARCDSAWADELREAILAQRPDLVVVQGASTRLREGVDDGLADGCPHRAFVYEMWGLPSCGTVVLSRLPLRDGPPRSSDQPVVGVDLGFGPVTLVPVDVPGPHDGLGPWREAIDGVGEAVESASGGVAPGDGGPVLDGGLAPDGVPVPAAGPVPAGGPVLVAVDFNAVREHEPLRRLLDRFGARERGGASGRGVGAHLPRGPVVPARACDRPRARVSGARGGRGGDGADRRVGAPRAGGGGAGALSRVRAR